jgi:dihydrofolate reductase
MENREIAIVVALDEKNAIGKNGNLLCHLPNDLKHFKRITENYTVVMGRKTFESLPKGALPNRKNIVLTSGKAEDFPGCRICRTPEEIRMATTDDEKIFIIGGAHLYRTALPCVNRLYITRIHHTFGDADTFFPDIDWTNWKQLDAEKHPSDEKHAYDYTFETYELNPAG